MLVVMNNNDMRELAPATATVEDVAKHFGVASRTVHRWLKHTDIPHRRVGRTIRFNLDEVNRWSVDATADLG